MPQPDLQAMAGNANEEADEEEELDTFDENALPSTSSGFMRPRTAGQARPTNEDYSPLSGQGYFAQALAVQVDESHDDAGGKVAGPSTFRVYYTPPANTDSQVASAHDESLDEESPVVFVCHHGAGYSGMSFALLAKQLAERSNGQAGVLAIDSRGHGKTVCQDDSNLSIQTLADDLVRILAEVFPTKKSTPDLVLVGHSMGGSVVVNACSRVQQEIGNVVGVCNLDVVEGTAMEALSGMMDIVSARPKGFSSLEEAIAWHVRTKTIGSLQSARISVPPLLLKHEQERDPSRRFQWRSNLPASQPFWEGWFKNLSSSFLSQRTAKLLVLAGAESLDKDLMIGQMQGKYQLAVFQDVGHCLQEEAPGRLAELLLEFWKRNLGDRDQAKILAKVRKMSGR